jgi:hypothetical protein
MMSAKLRNKLPKSWPPTARHILLDAARFFYREMNEPFPVYDVNMEHAVEYANRELEGRQREIYEEASLRWINRWESGQLDAEMKKAIGATYGNLRRAERGLRSHATVGKRAAEVTCKRCKGVGYIYTNIYKTQQEACPACDKLGKVTARKKSRAKLDAEIAQLLSERRAEPKSSRSHATILGRGMITEEQARALPRFEFIARWLAVVTKKKENRGPLGLYVKRTGTRWQIMSPVGGGTVTYETADPALLFDHARRGQLGSHIRDAEDFRGLAYERAGVR